MLQNRVDPFGNIIKTPARGTIMGNRGVIHDDTKQIRRPFKLKAWIACVLEYKGKRRPIMAPNRWTELFFLDEATAFAAGHRPCFECRREDANKFKQAWLQGNPQYNFNPKTSINQIDVIIHAERISENKTKITYNDNPATLPNGTFVRYGDNAYLINNGLMYLWSPSGYEKAIPFPKVEYLPVLTPLSVANSFKAGYVPKISLNTVPQ